MPNKAKPSTETLSRTDFMLRVTMIACLTVQSIAFSTAPFAMDDKSGPDALKNSNIVRWARGEYEYRASRDKRHRGRETFYLTVHADGSRTMRAYPDIAVRDIQSNVILRVDASFRPISAYMTYFSQSRSKGALAIFIDGNRLRSISLGSEGLVERMSDVPNQFSLVLHPLALDGWHPWYIAARPGEEQAGTEFMVETNPDSPETIAGRVITQSFVYRGQEQLTVPAGTFTTDRVTMAGHSDIWFTSPDRILVRYVWAELDREYVLRVLETGN